MHYMRDEQNKEEMWIARVRTRAESWRKTNDQKEVYDRETRGVAAKHKSAEEKRK